MVHCRAIAGLGRVLLALSLTGFAAASANSQLAASGWPKVNGDLGNTGQSSGSGATGTYSWELHTNGGISTAAAFGEDGTVYYGTETGYLVAQEPGHSPKWAIHLPTGGGSTPVVGQDGTIYQNAGMVLYAVSPAGYVKWTYGQLRQNILSPPVLGRDGTIYVTWAPQGEGVDSVVALRPNGVPKWVFPLGKLTFVPSDPGG